MTKTEKVAVADLTVGDVVTSTKTLGALTSTTTTTITADEGYRTIPGTDLRYRMFRGDMVSNVGPAVAGWGFMLPADTSADVIR